MQLQMTAPLDIGMDQNDATLNMGQEDVFDLNSLQSGRKQPRLPNDPEDLEEGSDDGQLEGKEASDFESVDGVEELEADMDDLYEAYRERRNEKDAKFKAKEARSKDKNREEWSGFKAANSEDESESEDEAGGWEEMEAAKAADGSSSESESEDEDASDAEELNTAGKRGAKLQQDARKKRKLVVDLGSKSKGSTSLWFDQDIFNDIDMDEVEDEPPSLSPDEDEVDDDEKPVRFAGLTKIICRD